MPLPLDRCAVLQGGSEALTVPVPGSSASDFRSTEALIVVTALQRKPTSAMLQEVCAEALGQ